MTVEIGTKKQRGPTPNFIRELFREDALVARQVLREIMLGGLELTPEAAEQLHEADRSDLGCNHVVPLQVATIDQRISAAKAVLQTGVGFKTDHTTDDEPLGRGVVLMPPWDEQRDLPDTPNKGALTSGKPSGNGGNGKQ